MTHHCGILRIEDVSHPATAPPTNVMDDTIDDTTAFDRTAFGPPFAAPRFCGHAPTQPAPRPGPPTLGGGLSSTPYGGGLPQGAQHAAANGAQSIYDGAIVTTLLDRGLVASILPAGLDLAPLTDTSVTTHPVVYLLGRQNDPCLLENGAPAKAPATEPYTELILLIPFVVRTGFTDRWHSYAARMYLDNFWAIAIGNGFYAYSKEWGDFDLLGNTTEVRWQNQTVFETEVVDDGLWMPATQAAAGGLPGFAEALALFDMPIVGHNALLNFVCSRFEWDPSQAQVAAAVSSHRFLQEFRAGMQDWIDLGFLANAVHGAFRVRGMRWRLSFELPIQRSDQPPRCDFA